MSYNFIYVTVGICTTLLTGCMATSMITNNQIVAETAVVLGLPTNEVTVQNRQAKDAKVYYTANTKSGDIYNCIIYGKDYRLGARLENPPECEIKESHAPSNPSKATKSKSTSNDKGYIDIGRDKKNATIYVDTANTRALDSKGDVYHAIIKYKFYETTKATNAIQPDGWRNNKPYTPKVSYAIIDSVVSCGGVKRMSVTDYQLYESPDNIIDETYKSSAMIANLNINSQNVVLHYFCSK